MTLGDTVTVSGRFQRSVRIDTDLVDPSSLEGFICPRSSAIILEDMARHFEATGHGAFTWTGPYGSGKSSLAVAFAALLSGPSDSRQRAADVIGQDTASRVWDALRPGEDGWRVLPVIGRLERPEQAIGEAIASAGFSGRGRRRKIWREAEALSEIQRLATADASNHGGLIVIVDEMGKFLEGAARGGADVYFFQQLAELASRSSGRLILIGILHQAFEEYAHRLARESQEEWSKIQGRFIDLPVNVAAGEQITLISRAIRSKRRSRNPSELARYVADQVTTPKSSDLPDLLERCWPLHPVVAALLGPISRRRFGQNQRSLFGFLNSAEPHGFQDFLRVAEPHQYYLPDRLWNYLQTNLEPSIMASPDGHRWAMAVDAIERCRALGGGDLHVRLLRTLSTLDLFKDRSGLLPTRSLLTRSMSEDPPDEVDSALGELIEWSLVIQRRLTNSYSIFEGSDFDIEDAVRRNLQSLPEVDAQRLSDLAGLQPVVAKRHYHENGTMTWFEAAVVPASELNQYVSTYEPRNGAAGLFVLAVPTRGESPQTLEGLANTLINDDRPWDLAVGAPQGGWNITSEVRELMAVEDVQALSPALQGDAVARREVESRASMLRDYVEADLGRAFHEAIWHVANEEPRPLSRSQLNSVASDLASRRYHKAPRIHNELLNRVKPSGNAVAARNLLLRHMALNEGQDRLGIRDFPAEGGLCDSLLVNTGLYRETETGYRFMAPVDGEDDAQLKPAWLEARNLLSSEGHRSVPAAEIYDLWRQPPFGIKDGLLPVLAAAFVLSHRRELAFYREGLFQGRITDLDLEVLAHDPKDIQLRWMALSEQASLLLSEMASVVRALDTENQLSHLEPIDVARGLVAIHDALPAWVGRTQQLSANAKNVRQLFRRAKDPNRLLFDDIPQVLTGKDGSLDEDARRMIVDGVRDGLHELQEAYPLMLERLKLTLLDELQVPNDSPASLAELRMRAENVRQLAGDHRMEALVLRLAGFEGAQVDVESLGSMAANKPLQTWVDSDVERAMTELASMCQEFMRLESLAHVKGRRNRRHAMAVTVGLAGRPSTVQEEFEVTSADATEIEDLVHRIEQVVSENGNFAGSIVLAALAELADKYMRDKNKGS